MIEPRSWTEPLALAERLVPGAGRAPDTDEQEMARLILILALTRGHPPRSPG